MHLVINHHSGVPAYRQIMDQIKFQIAGGVLAAGEELPSTRNLSAELSVNPMTVSKAYGLLEREGVLERRRGLTLTVRDRGDGALAAGRIEQLRQSLAPVISATRQLGVPDDEVVRILRKMLDERKEPQRHESRR